MKTKNLFLITVVVCTFLTSSLFAQGACGSCSFCYCESDVGCNGSDCANPGGCTSSTFTAPCTGTYQIASKVICDSHCDYCSACVYVYKTTDLTTPVGECHNHDCNRGDCAEICTAPLTGCVNYTIKVCLVFCPGWIPPRTCQDCGESCKAYGCVYRNIITTCVPL